MKKKRWYYVFPCPICSKRVEVMADPGVTPDTLAVPFDAPCPNCRVPVEYRSDQLTQLER